MKSDLLTPLSWEDYELIDSGNYEKLERFGAYVLARPEPQAMWNKSLPDAEWNKMAHAVFTKDGRGEDRGDWALKPGIKEQWHVKYAYKGMKLRMRLGFTAFKHVGIFPEQGANWNWIYDRVKEQGQNSKVLNMFAYTGGASLAARSAGASVTHVDAIKQVVTWSRENMEASGLDNIRWVVEDALKFAKREAKRGNKYSGIILDPPAYGRGPNGERWVLNESINELLSECAKLMEPGAFLVLNLYSLGMSALLARTIVRQLFGDAKAEQFGELYQEDRFKKVLPLGVYYRGVF